jgi:release factor glutamine methyltransferase
MSADTSLTVTAAEKKTWTILEILGTTVDYLKKKGIDDARLNAELLHAHVHNCRRIDLYANFDKPIRESEREQYKSLLKRRVAREPLQYILGETEFMGLRFVVDRRVLIPRPDTETLVEKTIDVCRQFPGGTESISILDIGTGCGNIAVSLGKFVGNAYVTAIDVSADALEVARKNGEMHNVSTRIEWRVVDVLSDAVFEIGDTFDMVVSNPPYGSEEDLKGLQPEILKYEPKIAIFDGGDGLKFLRRISEVGNRLLRKGGYLLFEVGFDQSLKIKEIMEAFGYEAIEVFKDLAGIHRVIKGRRPN